MNELECVLRAYQAVSQARGVAALASVVDVRGSAYRRIGGHMLLTDDGAAVGSISGGCLDRDVRRRATYVMRSGKPEHVVYDSPDDDDAAGPFPLGCNGVVEILIERLLPGDAYIAFVDECVQARQSAVVATVFAGGGAPAGGRLLWRPGKAPLALGIDNSAWALALVLAAQEVFASGASVTRTLETAFGQAAVCFEIIAPPPRLVIFGGGRDAVPLAALARIVGTRVIVVDPRPGHATRFRFPGADGLIVAEPQLAVDSLALDANSLAVVMSHNYRQDLAALRALLPTPIRYLGVLGPRARTSRLLADLAAAGIIATEAQLSRLYGPAGLDLGAETAAEVALAIMSESKAVLAGRRSGSLRERQKTLHQQIDTGRDWLFSAQDRLVPHTEG